LPQESAGFILHHLNREFQSLFGYLGLGLFCQMVDIDDGGNLALRSSLEFDGAQGAVGLKNPSSPRAL
jgi:hypothetical protein